ncbi:non-ribosomal peptide synthetase, partial [Dactylosporangium siamense]
DEWSSTVLHRELDALYHARELPPLSVQYADFAVWQRRWLTGDVLDRQLGYWRGRLEGAPVLALPIDRPRPLVRSSAGAVSTFVVPADVVEGLRVLSRAAGVSMFMTVFAAFNVLLARYTGQDDIVVGTPIANRNRAETEPLIGYFVNTLVLRTDLTGDPTFTELLHRVRTHTLAAYTHQDVPFERLVEELGTDRDRSRTPLFQVLFNYFTDGDPAGAEQTREALAKFDLRLIMSESGGGAVHYATRLFHDATIHRLIGHLQQVLAAVAGNTDIRLSQLPLHTTSPAVTHRGVPAVTGVEALIDTATDTIAVTSHGHTLTYRQLQTRANQLAHHLRAAGVTTESVIGVATEHGTDFTTAVLAIWRAGGAYLPLDPTQPTRRTAHMLTEGGVTLILGTTDTLADLPTGRLRTIRLDDPNIDQHLHHPPTPASAATLDRVAYVLFTSGSTGQPKAVQVTHRGLVNYLTTVPDAIGIGTPGASYALLQRPNTDFANTLLYTALTTGGTAHFHDPHTTTTIPDTINYTKIVPSHLTALGPEHITPNRGLILGGEATPLDLAHHLLTTTTNTTAGGGGRTVANHYGPTETTIGVAATLLHPEHLTDGTVPIGAALPNTRLYLLDHNLRPVPTGTPGHLHVAGPSLARGYRNRPDLTADRFIADPFTSDGSRMYATGDLARQRPDGLLTYLGRIDNQIKIRGHRIEPTEIQTALQSHPTINHAVITNDGPRLIAYLVTNPTTDTPPTVTDLRAHLTDQLPDHMIPTTYIHLDTIPHTTNGKIDYTALPNPDHNRPELTTTPTPPTTPTQHTLTTIWTDTLGINNIGIHDNFFDLGGHSLLATQ